MAADGTESVVMTSERWKTKKSCTPGKRLAGLRKRYSGQALPKIHVVLSKQHSVPYRK